MSTTRHRATTKTSNCFAVHQFYYRIKSLEKGFAYTPAVSELTLEKEIRFKPEGESYWGKRLPGGKQSMLD
jgi:hypothetical protein